MFCVRREYLSEDIWSWVRSSPKLGMLPYTMAWVGFPLASIFHFLWDSVWYI